MPRLAYIPQGYAEKASDPEMPACTSDPATANATGERAHTMMRLASGLLSRLLPVEPGARRTVFLCLLHVMLVWGVAIMVMNQNRERSVESWKSSTRNLALTVAAHAEQTQRAAELVLQSMADWVGEERIETEAQFRRVMGERRFFEEMRDRIVGQPQVGLALVVAAGGDVINSTLVWPSRGENIADREAFRMALEPGALPLSATSVGRLSGKPRFYLARKILSAQEELLGVIAVGLEADFFAEFYRRIVLGADGWLGLFRIDGTLLATSLSGQKLGQRFDSSVPHRMIAAGQSGMAVLSTGPFSFHAGDGASQIIVAQKVEGFPAYVAVAVGESTFLEAWRERNLVIAGIAFALTGLTVIVGLQIFGLFDRVAMATRIDAERRVLAAIVDTPAALTAVVDAGGKVLHANGAFRGMLGCGPGDLVEDALSRPVVKGAEGVRAFMRSNSPVGEAMLELVRPLEQPRHLRFSMSRQSLPGSGRCVIMVGQDDTVRYRAERAIALSGKLVTLGEITTGIAHELSQPLNVIRMAAQNALAEAAPARAAGVHDEELPSPAMTDREFRDFAAAKLSRVVAQVDRAAGIISRMRIFSRSTRDGPQRFDLRDACRDAAILVAQPFRAAGIEIVERLGEEPLMTVGHQSLIEQVLVNLLANARDALSDALHKDRKVEISARRTETGRLVIRVADNGPGVPEAARDRIFEPFYTTKPEGQGTGLGLAVAYGIVRDAGGSLALRPEGPGAAFEIDLPGGPQQ